MGGIKPYGLPKFNGEDFPVWKAIIKSHLVAHMKYDAITDNYLSPCRSTDDKVTKAKLMEIEEFQQKDDEVKALLMLSVEARFVKQIMNCYTAKGMWERLLVLHEQSSRTVYSLKKRQFNNLKLKKDEAISDYIARAEYLFGQLEDIGVKNLTEFDLVDQIVCGLSSQYHSFITIWMDRDNGRKTSNDLISRLTAGEPIHNKFSRKKEHKNDNALVATTSKANHSNKKDDKKFKKKYKLKCFICHVKGHTVKQCPQYDPDYKKKKQEAKIDSCDNDKNKPTKDREKESRSSRKNDDDYDNAIVAEDEANFTSSSSKWIIDCGANRHMTNERSDFITYKKFEITRRVNFSGQEKGIGIGFGNVSNQNPSLMTRAFLRRNRT